MGRRARSGCAIRGPLGTAVLTLAIAGLVVGCELVAAIQDLRLTGDAGVGATSDATVASDAPGQAGEDRAAGPVADSSSQPSDSSNEMPAVGVIDASDGGRDATADAADGGLVTELIDDMEANNGQIRTVNGRTGGWYDDDDGTDGGTETPSPSMTFLPTLIVPARGSSRYASRFSGSGFVVWGSSAGFNLDDPYTGPDAGRGPYDASKYKGFTFYARIGAGTTASVRFVASDHNTDGAGGVCSPCGDAFGVNLTFTTSWTQYVVYYTDMRQQGYGSPQVAALDPTRLYACQFNVGPRTTFDVWIDDIAFIVQ
jgi:hypothetical protein